MKRSKHHKVKKEVPETSTSHNRVQEEHDLAYYIHDRVELMHQVFSVLKYKELKAMAPACIRNISLDDLQELCTEELLGISSKRLCAILDGAEPPSDTESSSQSPTEQLETISLESISSDEEILSQDERNKKKKHKHRRRDSKSKHKRSKPDEDEQQTEKSKASRAGLTVLELLELQARARAIRAQLQKEQIKLPDNKSSDSVVQASTQSHSEDEVEIKEEPAEVVEISSDEEKPKIEELEISKPQPTPGEPQSDTVVKYVSDLVITVPQKKTQKIKLNRTKPVPETTVTKTTAPAKTTAAAETTTVSKDTTPKTIEENTFKDMTKDDINKDIVNKDNTTKTKDKTKKKKKKRISNGSDNDEITLQLSDSEKMDLLEDLDRKNYDNVSSDTSSDSEEEAKEKRDKRKDRKSLDVNVDSTKTDDSQVITEKVAIDEAKRVDRKSSNDEESVEKEPEPTEVNEPSNKEVDNIIITEKEKVEDRNDEMENSDDTSVINSVETDKIIESNTEQSGENDKGNEDTTKGDDKIVTETEKKKEDEAVEAKESRKSEGELSDRDSSEVEAVDLQPVVVCISDEEENKTKKKKKKKDKKSKKDKKNKKKDFRESGDENFRKINETPIDITESSNNDLVSSKRNYVDNSASQTLKDKKNSDDIDLVTPEKSKDSIQDNRNKNEIEVDLTTPDKSQDVAESIANKTIKSTETVEDKFQDTEIIEVKECPTDRDEEDSPNDIVEIYELSDYSSNDEDIETNTVLSKEPTASEIEALSAKIDEIERVEVITDEEIREYESNKKQEEEIAMSWKDRYLDSKKVKKVLNTSNILNALRKKNRQLKKRLEESKIEMSENMPNEEVSKEDLITEEKEIAEGSIEHYNTLQGSTKFVNPVSEVPINDTLKKDAKILLRMYRKLLKYNDMNRQKNPNKKKKKKSKEKEEDSVKT